MKIKHLPFWIYTISIYVSLLICQFLFNEQNFVLNNFSDRTIGISVLEGINISQRSFLYVEIIISFIFTYSVSYHICLKINSIIQKHLKNHNKKEEMMLFIFSSYSTFLLINTYLQDILIYKSLNDIFVLLMLLTFCILFLKRVFIKNNRLLFNYLSDYNFVILSFLSPIVIFFIGWVFKRGTFTFRQTYFLPYFILWISFWVIIYIITKKFTNKKAILITHGLLRSVIPLLLIPASIVLSNEIQFTLSNTIFNKSAYKYSVISTLLLLIISLVVFLISILKKRVVSKNIAGKIYLSIFISTIVLFKIHSNFIELPIIVDMFHHGENLISTQQLFLFNKLPFIDIYPTHGISYMIGQSLYSLVNGYKSFEPWLWEWIVKIFEVLLLYFVFKKITNSFFAAITIAFLPFLGIFGGNRFVYGYDTKLLSTYYFAAFLPCLTLAWALKKPDFKRISIYWITCVFLLLWRVDFGISNIITGIGMFTILLIGERIGNVKMNIKISTLIKSAILIGLITLITFTIGVKISGSSFRDIIIQNFEFISFQATSQGLIKMANSISLISFFQYFLLPFIGVFYVLTFITNAIFKEKFQFRSKHIILVSIAIFSLIISTRSTQRQTLAVLGLNQYLFVFLGMCLPFYLNKFKNISIALFVFLLFIYQLVMPNNLLLIKDGKQIIQYDWLNKESRVKINDRQYNNVSKFLNNNLNNDQTFIDLTSSPLLYITTNREFINYLIPNTYHTSEQIQKIILNKLDNLFNAEKVPIVIFKQPISAANALDLVPNELRSYRIYEFIYKNYEPAGIVDEYTIWVKIGHKLKDTTNLTYTEEIAQSFELKMLPYMWANFDEYDAIHNSEIQDLLINSPTNLNSNINKTFAVDSNIQKNSGNYIYLNILSSVGGKIDISYGNKIISSIKFDLFPSEKPVDYLVRISSQYNWISNNIKSIAITSNTNIMVNSLEIRKGD